MNDESSQIIYNGLDSLLQPDTIISFEYFGVLGRNGFMEPERRLMLAVLENALVCYQRHVLATNGRKKRLFSEAESWIWDNHDDWPFSFLNITDATGLSPEWIRSKLMQWKRTKTRQHDWICVRHPRKVSKAKPVYGELRVAGIQESHETL